MLQIVCVKAGTKYGPEYVNKLEDMVRRNLPGGFPGKFVCFTDDPAGLSDGIEILELPNNLTGWFNKLYLFKAGLFPHNDRILYFDLDTLITGPLDEIVKYDGEFAILRDFYRPKGLQSSVIAWEANTHRNIWEEYEAAGYPDINGGDQAWIECKLLSTPQLWQDLYPKSFVSYKVHCQNGPVKGAKVVVFHGHPRPHEVTEGWVPSVWKIGGGTSFEQVLVCNTESAEIEANIRHALTLGLPEVQWQEPHDKHAVIVGGAPSLKDSIEEIRWRQSVGQQVFATNNTYTWLAEQRIRANCHIMVDARPENAKFAPKMEFQRYSGHEELHIQPHCYYASQCHPDIFSATKDCDITLWHPMLPGMDEILGDRKYALIGGGSTVCLKAIALAYTLGFREFHLYGMDSSYGETHHAYPQSMNDGERVIEVDYCGEKYRCAPWMVTQADEFRQVASALVASKCTVTVHGDGLIPAIARDMQDKVLPADIRAYEIFSRIDGIKNPVGAEIGVFTGQLSHRLLQRDDLVLYMVDSWATSDEESDYAKSGDFHAGLTQKQQDAYHDSTLNSVGFAQDRAKVIRKPSAEAAHDVPNHSLDFVFIDADHSYEGCKADILAWQPKVRPGGLVSGHDYKNTDYPCFGVDKAVDEFCSAHNLQLELGENFTWFARL